MRKAKALALQAQAQQAQVDRLAIVEAKLDLIMERLGIEFDDLTDDPSPQAESGDSGQDEEIPDTPVGDEQSEESPEASADGQAEEAADEPKSKRKK